MGKRNGASSQCFGKVGTAGCVTCTGTPHHPWGSPFLLPLPAPHPKTSQVRARPARLGTFDSNEATTTSCCRAPYPAAVEAAAAASAASAATAASSDSRASPSKPALALSLALARSAAVPRAAPQGPTAAPSCVAALVPPFFCQLLLPLLSPAPSPPPDLGACACSCCASARCPLVPLPQSPSPLRCAGASSAVTAAASRSRSSRRSWWRSATRNSCTASSRACANQRVRVGGKSTKQRTRSDHSATNKLHPTSAPGAPPRS